MQYAMNGHFSLILHFYFDLNSHNRFNLVLLGIFLLLYLEFEGNF